MTCEDLLEEGLQPAPLPVETEAGCWTYATFEEATDAEQGQPGSPSLAIDADGAIHIVYSRYLHDDDLLERRHVTNASGSWQGETFDCDSGAEGSGGTILAIGGGGVLHVLGLQPVGRDQSLVLDSATGGIWHRQEIGGFDHAPSYDLTTDVAGELHLVVGGPDRDANSGELAYMTGDRQEVWSSESIPAGLFAGRYAELAVAENGVAYVLSENACPGGPELDDGCRISAYQRDLELSSNERGAWTTEKVASNLDGNSAVALAVGGDESLHVAYVDTDNAVSYGVRDRDGWSLLALPSEELYTGATIAMAVDDFGMVHLVVATVPGFVDYATNRDGEWRTERLAEVGYEVESVILDDLGRPNVVYRSDIVGGATIVFAVRTCP